MIHLKKYDLFESLNDERKEIISIIAHPPGGNFSFYALGVIPVHLSEGIVEAAKDNYDLSVSTFNYLPELKYMEFLFDEKVYGAEDYSTKPIKLSSDKEWELFGKKTQQDFEEHGRIIPPYTYLLDLKQKRITNIDVDSISGYQKSGFVVPLKELEGKFLVLPNGDDDFPGFLGSWSWIGVIDYPKIAGPLTDLQIIPKRIKEISWSRVK